MKFSALASLAVVAISASSTLGSLYDADALPDGRALPRRSRHPLSEQRRRALVDTYYAAHPEEARRDLAEADADADEELAKRGSSKSCKAKTHRSKNSKSSKAAKKHVEQASAANTDSKAAKSSSDKKQQKSEQTTEHKTEQKSTASSSSSSSSSNDASGIGKGLFGMRFSGACSDPRASDKYPNGNIDFLNCGISKQNPSSKWQAPNVKLSDLRVISAHQAAQSDTFKPCAKYEGAFTSAEKATGVPAVLLMSFAMQESTCNPSVTGGNGEIGMMQLTPDKCGGINCWDAATNIMTGAKYFKSEYDSRGQNVLAAAGAYNGWQDGQLSYSSATNQQWGCHAQNNLDYLNQLFNGWCQGKTGYDLKVYNNLGSCSG